MSLTFQVFSLGHFWIKRNFSEFNQNPFQLFILVFFAEREMSLTFQFFFLDNLG